jgi:hypothetical protein
MLRLRAGASGHASAWAASRRIRRARHKFGSDDQCSPRASWSGVIAQSEPHVRGRTHNRPRTACHKAPLVLYGRDDCRGPGACGQDAPDAVAASRVLVLASVPYGVFVCLRCALDGCDDTAFNTQHVVASTVVFGALVGGVLAFDPFAYCGPLWTFVIAVWVLGTFTIFWLRRVFAATAPTAGAM